ncbi:uncharacterized protein LOC123592408 [Leopardus geoffroyi]|uniref:uncharacterized protein LOC123592408 n=1 Tax=Leopardus geoffroyi TaxID=46844 RepID=UPI001E26622F|nr:uncharacterized protein LOC123592408 [Leopardus geoffroyi]
MCLCSPAWRPSDRRGLHGAHGTLKLHVDVGGGEGSAPGDPPISEAAPRRTCSRVHGHLAACAGSRRAEAHGDNKRGPGVHPATSWVGAGVRGGAPAVFRLPRFVIYKVRGTGRPLAHPKYENAIYGKPSCENDPALPLDETQRVWTASADTPRQLGDPGQCSLLCPRLPAHLPKERHHPRGPGPAAQKVYGRCDALTASSRYGCILPYSDEDGGPQDQLKNAISSILGTWLDQYSEDFCQPPDWSVSHLEASGGEGRTLKMAGQGCDASGLAAGRCLCRANSGDRQEAGQRGRPLPLPDRGAGARNHQHGPVWAQDECGH